MILAKLYEGTFNIQVYIINDILCRSGITVYILKDLNNHIIKGIFYKEELQNVEFDKNSSFKIEKILHTKRQGDKTLYKVRWLGYDKHFDSYIEKDKLISPSQ